MAQYTTKSFPPCWPPGPESSGVWGSSITAGLTPHGGEQIRLMGRWMGTSNFSGVSCDDVAVYADISSSRDNETATNWTLGAFPTCKALHQEEVIKGDAKQVLFNDGSNQELCGFQSSKVIQSFLGGGKYEALLNAWKSQIQLVDSVVHCCSSELCPGHLPCNLSSLPIKYTGKFWAATEGAFDIAVFWAEFFLLEYLNGNPQYAQGQLGVSDLVDLYRMAVENIEIMDDHFASRSFESTMASHILGTLLQAAERKPIPGLSHSQNTKVVYMAGHDTNLILLRLLLGLRWQSHGWAQNGVAPGGMLIFELEQRQEGGPVVSIYFQVAQPAQLREGQPFSEPQAPSRVQVAITDCPGDPFACPLDAFKKMVISKLRPECIGIPALRDLVENHGAGSVPWPAQYWWTFLLTGLAAFLLGAAISWFIKKRRSSSLSSGYSSQELTS
ncbi:unnamed protein product [Durusdinium trenchii]